MKEKKTITYRIRNWRQYNKALVNRGSLTIWFEENTLAAWLNHQRSGQPGAPQTYSNTAILCMATLQAVYHLPLRATQGLLGSLVQLLGLNLPVPNFTTLSRRRPGLAIPLPRIKGGGLHVLIDSTGLKVYGEGEWKVRQHGYSKRRTWRKLHLALNEATGEIIAAVATDNWTSDKSVFGDLLEQIPSQLKKVTTDGAYDYVDCYELIAKRQAQAVIPPRRTGRIRPQDERFRARNANLRRIRQVGRKRWKQESGYHRRSLVETTMMRLKTIFGPALSARRAAGQAKEMFLRCFVLNRMTKLGLPESYPV